MIQLFGGGTLVHVRNHLALCAPAYGGTVRALARLLDARQASCSVTLTRMADPSSPLETNDDIAAALTVVLAQPATRALFFNVALCDYVGQIGDVPSGKYADRLPSRDGVQQLHLSPAAKLLPGIKAARPDVFVVGSKTTAGDSRDEQVGKARRQLAETGINLVLANDTVTRCNLLVSRKGVVQAERATLLTTLADCLATGVLCPAS